MTDDDEALLDATTTSLQTRLAGYQYELYRQVLNEIQSGVLRPAATELAGGKALLDSFITLGFPRAIANDELFIDYQPIVDLGSRSLLGMEALVRWRHPELGVLMPDRFIQVAEECGQIVKLEIGRAHV